MTSPHPPKTTFCAYARKNCDDDGCNDNYGGNFDEYNDKNYQKTYKYKESWVNIYQF